METFTIRIPRSWVRRIDGQQVRAWVESHLTAPKPLAPVKEELTSRTSLRLPGGRVQELVRRTGLSTSEALRRVIAAGLRSSVSVPVPVQRVKPAKRPDSDIVSERVVGMDPNGAVVIEQRDSRGFGYRRSLGIGLEAYLKAGRT